MQTKQTQQKRLIPASPSYDSLTLSALELQQSTSTVALHHETVWQRRNDCCGLYSSAVPGCWLATSGLVMTSSYSHTLAPAVSSSVVCKFLTHPTTTAFAYWPLYSLNTIVNAHYWQQLNMDRAFNQPLKKDKQQNLCYKTNQMGIKLLEAAKMTYYVLRNATFDTAWSSGVRPQLEI